jgi:hypothetical protein
VPRDLVPARHRQRLEPSRNLERLIEVLVEFVFELVVRGGRFKLVLGAALFAGSEGGGGLASGTAGAERAIVQSLGEVGREEKVREEEEGVERGKRGEERRKEGEEVVEDESQSAFPLPPFERVDQ